MPKSIFIFLAFCLIGCCHGKPNSLAYRTLYAHLENPPAHCQASWNSEYFLIIYVNARHLDYTNNYSFLKTIAIHPSDGSTNRDIGHAWIYLQGIQNGRAVCVYGGHSGERGLTQAKYFDGVMNYIDFGYANPTQLRYPCYEPNPIKYLWETQHDGYFEWGSGIHQPTYAAKVDLTEEQFERIVGFINSYDFSCYALTGNQCSTFVTQAAALAGLDLECSIEMNIEKELYLYGERVRLWEDPYYSRLNVSTPDIVERSLMEAVADGRACRIR